jgi:hypothetical protein
MEGKWRVRRRKIPTTKSMIIPLVGSDGMTTRKTSRNRSNFCGLRKEASLVE